MDALIAAEPKGAPEIKANPTLGEKPDARSLYVEDKPRGEAAGERIRRDWDTVQPEVKALHQLLVAAEEGRPPGSGSSELGDDAAVYLLQYSQLRSCIPGYPGFRSIINVIARQLCGPVALSDDDLKRIVSRIPDQITYLARK